MYHPRPRYDSLYIQYGRKLADAIRRNESGREWAGTDRQIFERFAEIDPTRIDDKKPRGFFQKNYVYLSWLITTYLKGRHVSARDFPTLTHFLKIFSDKKSVLPKQEQDIHQYDFPGFIKKICEIEGIKYTGRELKRHRRSRVDAETTVLYKGPLGLVLIPHSIRAAAYWGKNAKWCTTASVTNNLFHHYTEIAPLVTFIARGKKFQVHNTVIFNEENRSIDITEGPLELIAEVLERYPGLKDFVINDHHVSGLRRFKKTDDLDIPQTDLEITYQNPEIIPLLPEEKRNDHNFIMEVVSINPEALEYIEDQTRDIILKVIEVEPRCIRYANQAWRSDPEIMSLAIGKDWATAAYLDESLSHNHEFLKEYLKKHPEMVLVLPRSYKNEQEVREYLKKDAMLMKYAVPYHDDREMAELAILSDLSATQWIPQKIWTEIPSSIKRQAWEKAIKKDWKKISLVHDCEITLSPQRELDIFKAGLRSEPELLEKTLYLFPSLRTVCFQEDMTSEKALDILQERAGLQMKVLLQNDRDPKLC